MIIAAVSRVKNERFEWQQKMSRKDNLKNKVTLSESNP